MAFNLKITINEKVKENSDLKINRLKLYLNFFAIV